MYDPKEGKRKELKIKAFNIEIKRSKAITMAAKTSKPIESKEIILEENVVDVGTFIYTGWSILLHIELST
jgi:hypothetical protein